MIIVVIIHPMMIATGQFVPHLLEAGPRSCSYIHYNNTDAAVVRIIFCAQTLFSSVKRSLSLIRISYPDAHAVFDTCNVHNDKAFGLEFHLDRLLRGAAETRIEHTYSKESLREIILATIAAGGRKEGVDAFVKYWLSAGRCSCVYSM